jgi:hypothetical protein
MNIARPPQEGTRPLVDDRYTSAVVDETAPAHEALAVADAPASLAPTVAPDPRQAGGDALRECIRIAAGLSLAAGAVHAIATVDHFSHYWVYGVFFMLVTYGQVLWGVALWRNRASARTLTIGAYANLAIVAVWLGSRIVGIPFGPYAFDAEPVAMADAAATIDELLIAAYVGLILHPRLRGVRGLRVLHGPFRVHIGMMVVSASLFAGMFGGHAHG